MLPKDSILYLPDAHGIYIPKAFAEQTKRMCVAHVSAEDWECLDAGPDNEWYWEAWQNVLDHAVLTDPSNGKRYTVYQDGDCWLIPEGAEWDDSEL